MGLPQNWGRVETLGAAELALRQIEDCLEALNGRVAAGIVGSLFVQIVESVTEERERIMEEREGVIGKTDRAPGRFLSSSKGVGSRRV